MKGTQKRKIPIPLLTAAVMLLGIAVLLFTKYGKPEAQREDYKRISSLKYDTVFLSMYSIDTYQEEDFAYFRGMTLFKASYLIPDFSVMEQYMKRIAKSGNTITTAYLGICPEKTSPERLQTLVNRYPSVTFEIILSYPSADYWNSLSDSDYESILTAYCDFLTAAPGISNANFYFLGSQEWLVCNPGNYENNTPDPNVTVNEAIATVIMTHSDRDHGFGVTAENASSSAESLRALTLRIRTSPADLPDLSDHCILFFGDSVIAGYDDSRSIPGVVSGLTGATVYNCGWGGNSATMPLPDSVGLPAIMEALFSGDLSSLPQDEHVYQGIAAYLSDSPTDKKLCFVINYGLNDYFGGYAVSSEEPYDVTSYSGAIRTAVRTIRENAPDAQIILCSPNFTAAFQDGKEPHGERGHILSDYADAVAALSEELKTELLDNYHELGITHENHSEYLEDGVHPNADCRYLIGNRLIRLIR